MGTYQEVKIIKNDEVSSLLDERNILVEDIQQVIFNAEEKGDKLYQPDGDKFLAKLEQSEATFYVEYSTADDGYTIYSAYFHRSQIVED